jgi:hypothetical protein
MQAAEILSTLHRLGITAYTNGDKLVCEPGSKLPPDLIPEIRQHKAELMALICQPNACTCDPLPSIKDVGYVAHAGVGPAYQSCKTCGYTWRCKLCLGCRYCRTPD